MMTQKCTIGVIGLSVMGRGLARNMADHGFQVAGFNRSAEVTRAVMAEEPNENLHPVYSLSELMEVLEKPRRILLMIKAGEPVDQMIDQLIPMLDAGDIILDGGNSFFADTRRRTEKLAAHGMHYFGVGVSGGETGARFGGNHAGGQQGKLWIHSADSGGHRGKGRGRGTMLYLHWSRWRGPLC